MTRIRRREVLQMLAGLPMVVGHQLTGTLGDRHDGADWIHRRDSG